MGLKKFAFVQLLHYKQNNALCTFPDCFVFHFYFACHKYQSPQPAGRVCNNDCMHFWATARNNNPVIKWWGYGAVE